MRHGHRVISSIGILLLVAGSNVVGQSRDSTRRDTTRIPELEVRAVKPILTTGGSSAIRLQLDSVPLPAAPTLEQTFRRLPLLHVRRNSRGESEISARGSESRQVAVLVDGIPLTVAWDSRTDASVLPTTAFREITYVRGLSSMLYGPNVLGGIIELPVGHSSYRPSRATAEVSSGIDHVGGFGSRVSTTLPLGGADGRWMVRAGGSFSDSPGVPLANGIVEPLPGEHENLRVNTDFQSVDGFGSLRYQGGSGSFLSLAAWTFKADRGMAAELGYDDARFWRYPDVHRSMAVISGGTGHHRSPFGGTGDVEASIGVDFGRTDIDVYSARDYQTLDGFEDGRDRTLTFRMLADQTLGSRGDLRTALTMVETRHDEFLPAGEARYRQQVMSVGAETDWRLIDMGQGINALRLNVGGAYDVAKTPETGGREPKQPTQSELGARVGLTLVAADGRLQTHASASRRARFPALRELYSGALNRFTPNPDLKPENLFAVEAGVTARLGSSSEIQLVGFRHQMNDAVVRITLPDNKFMRVNRNRLNSHGVELVASTVVGHVALGGDLTLQSANLTNTDANTTNRPENLPDAFGGAFVRANVPLGLKLGGEVRYTGTQFCIDPATGDDAELASGAVVNADLSREFSIGSAGGLFSRLEGTIAVDNLGDKAMYDQCRLPEPGRLLRFQVRIF